MEIIVDVGVGFQPTEVGQYIGESPLIVAHGGPGIVVLGDTAQQHLTIDGA